MEIGSTIEHLWQAVALFFENTSIHDLILRHGSWFWTVVFVWACLQGETFVIFAGAAAAQDVLDIKLLILFAWLGTFCGDQVYFYMGRRWGRRFLHHFPKFEHAVDKILKLIERHDRVYILFYRFIFGVRNISPFALGLSHLTWKEFSTWNFIASLVAAVGFSMLGFLFGETLENVLGETIDGVMIGTAVIVAIVFAVKLILNRQKKPSSSGKDGGKTPS
ncbi:MAG: DedA family protein [Proteobacteria bacterium]|nr:DedA family protein [Pseudomonadota bacterium]